MSYNMGEQFSLFDYIDADKRPIKFVDLFAGLGGTRLGFEAACAQLGYKTECVLTSEIKPHAIRALVENFEQDNLVGDIRQVDKNSIPDFDFLLGGFPCQAFSTAGKGLGFLDTRGTLFFEVERILKAKKPYGFILENVEGLVTHDKVDSSSEIGRTLTVILGALEAIGYQVSWRVIDSQFHGVAQSRKRIYIVGTFNHKIDLNIPTEKKVVLGDICEQGLPLVDSHFTRCLLSHYYPEQLYGKAIKDKRGGGQNIHSWDIGLKGEVSVEQKTIIEKLFKERRKRHWAEEIGIEWMDGMPLTLEQISTFCSNPNLFDLLEDLVSKGYLVKEHPKDNVEVDAGEGKTRKERKQDLSKPIGYNIVSGKLSFEFTKILDIKDVAPTLVAMDVSKLGVVDGQGIRRLSLREGLRLFGYPETYSLDIFKTKKEKAEGFDLLGNTVIVPVIKKVAVQVLNEFKREKGD